MFSLLHRSPAGCCIKSTFLQDSALIDLLNPETIIKVFSVEDPFSVLSELVSKKCPLLATMACTHMVRLVNVGCRTAVECSVILIELVLLGGLSTMEACLVSSKVGVLLNACTNAEATRDGTACHSAVTTILKRADMIHRAVI